MAAKKSPLTTALTIGLAILAVYELLKFLPQLLNPRSAQAAAMTPSGTQMYRPAMNQQQPARMPVKKPGSGLSIGGGPGRPGGAPQPSGGGIVSIGEALAQGQQNADLAGVLAGIFNQQAGYDYNGDVPNYQQTFGLSSLPSDVSTYSLATDPNAGGLTLDLSNWGTPVDTSGGSTAGYDTNPADYATTTSQDMSGVTIPYDPYSYAPTLNTPVDTTGGGSGDYATTDYGYATSLDSVG